MVKSLVVTLALAALSALFWLRRRQKKRADADRRARVESRGYVPLSLDNQEPDAFSRLVDLIDRMRHGFGLALGLLVISVVAFLAVTEPLVRWILAGTLALMVLVAVIWAVTRQGPHGPQP